MNNIYIILGFIVFWSIILTLSGLLLVIIDDNLTRYLRKIKKMKKS